MRTRRVHFEKVTVYYFSRRQGFTSVPSQGGSTLGMSSRHSCVRQYTLGEFAMEQERIHRDMLRDHLKEEKLNSIRLRVSKRFFCYAYIAVQKCLYYVTFCIVLSWRKMALWSLRRPMFSRWTTSLMMTWILITQRWMNTFSFSHWPLRSGALCCAHPASRSSMWRRTWATGHQGVQGRCGCDCRLFCDPETCTCSLAGIKCQVWSANTTLHTKHGIIAEEF